jgi:hypothetical protein
LIEGTLAGLISDKVREATGTVREPAEALKTIAVQMQEMNYTLRQLNSTMIILAERLK